MFAVEQLAEEFSMNDSFIVDRWTSGTFWRRALVFIHQLMFANPCKLIAVCFMIYYIFQVRSVMPIVLYITSHLKTRFLIASYIKVWFSFSHGWLCFKICPVIRKSQFIRMLTKSFIGKLCLLGRYICFLLYVIFKRFRTIMISYF